MGSIWIKNNFYWLYFVVLLSVWGYSITEIWGGKIGLFDFIFLNLIFIVLAVSFFVIVRQKLKNRIQLLSSLRVLGVLLYRCFRTTNLLVFYMCYERTVLPLLFIIWAGGSYARKSKRGWFLIFFTFFFSILFGISVIDIYLQCGTFDYGALKFRIRQLPVYKQSLYWWSFAFAFRVKIPIRPLHLWLPEAHVEASTPGSIVLAGIVLKLGFYGLLKYLIFFIPYRSYQFSNRIQWWALAGRIYARRIILVQVDLKCIIAYASISHINLGVRSIFTLTNSGVQGGMILIFVHGLVSMGLFFVIGCLYTRYNSRLITSYKGLSETHPLIMISLFFLLLANSAIPLTGNFRAERLIFFALLRQQDYILVCLLVGVRFLTTASSRWIFVRVRFGTLSLKGKNLDLIRWELMVIVFRLRVVIYCGCFPNTFFSIVSERYLGWICG
jgi:NADH:ubiquinone oxidoreductase subunit 4 (subunit M)